MAGHHPIDHRLHIQPAAELPPHQARRRPKAVGNDTSSVGRHARGVRVAQPGTDGHRSGAPRRQDLHPAGREHVAIGKTPPQLARDMETVLAEYVRSPKVNIIVTTAASLSAW